MPEIKLDAKVRRAVAEALEPWAGQMFTDQTGEWTAVVTLAHGARTEEIKTEDDFDYVATGVKLRILDAEVVTGEHAKTAEQARKGARAQRTTEGTLLEGAFDDQR